jgi:AraC-like DNA-binding protein
MTTTLLSRHPRIATSDIDQAREEVAAAFCPHRLSLTSRTGRLAMVHNAAPIAGVGIHYLRYGDEVRITPGTFDTFYLLQIPLAGRARVKVGDRLVASDRHYASLPSPTEPVDEVLSDGCEQLIVYLGREAVEQFAGTHAPDGAPSAVIFDPLVSLDSPRVRSWMRFVHLAREELEREESVLHSPIAAVHFEQVLIAGLLAAQPNNTVIAPPADARVCASRAVRDALELIESAPEHPWRVADLAAAVGVSCRTLQEAFRRERGVSPLEELRRTRLARARTDLVNGTPGTTSVTEVASRWGFFHLGRFSRTYREVYQESPSQTLVR